MRPKGRFTMNSLAAQVAIRRISSPSFPRCLFSRYILRVFEFSSMEVHPIYLWLKEIMHTRCLISLWNKDMGQLLRFYSGGAAFFARNGA